MKNVYVFPYKMGSKSATNLARALGVPQIKHTGSKFKGSKNKIVINWGASKLTAEPSRCTVWNKPEVVIVAGNKLSFFRRLEAGADKEHQSRLVPFTSDHSVAHGWLKEGSTVVVRNSLTGHSGHGIIIVEPGQELPKAGLYTKYVPKDSEYRIHIMKGEVIFRQRKIKDPDLKEPKTWKVRSHDNGFIFQHKSSDGTSDLQVPKDVEVQALKAFEKSGLDFCGVDVIFNRKANKAYVLEVNTAVGLEGSTIEVYKQAFERKLANA